MKLHLLTICYNESRILPTFLKYYLDLGVDKITVYDNMSTDNSVDICKSFGDKVEVVEYDSNGQIRDDIYLDIKNNKWKEFDADWVIVVDCDEFLSMNPNSKKSFKELLKIYTRKNNLLPVVNGYNVVFDGTLDECIDSFESETKMFVRDRSFDKRCVFTKKVYPKFNAGCHSFKLCGKIPSGVKVDSILKNAECEELSLIHMKHIDREYVIARYKEFNSRLSEFNKVNSYGTQYMKTEEELNDTFDYMKRFSKSFNEIFSK